MRELRIVGELQRSCSELPRREKDSDSSPLLPASPQCHPCSQLPSDISDSELTIRRIIAARNRPRNPSQPSTAVQAVRFDMQISSIQEELMGARREEEERRRRLKQHLLELVEGKEKLTYTEMFYESDVKRGKEDRLTLPEPCASGVSTATVPGPGSSFLVTPPHYYQHPPPLPTLPAPPLISPARNRSLSSIPVQTTIPPLTISIRSEARKANQRVKRTADALLGSQPRQKAAVFRLIEEQKSARVVIVLKNCIPPLFGGLYFRGSGILKRLYAVSPLPPSIPLSRIISTYGLDDSSTLLYPLSTLNVEEDVVAVSINL